MTMEEMGALVDEALRTLAAPRQAGVTLAMGQMADLIVLNRDPLHDLDALRRPDEISMVIKGGAIGAGV